MASKNEIATQKFAEHGIIVGALTTSPRERRSIKYMRTHTTILLDVPHAFMDYPDEIFGDIMEYLAKRIADGDAVMSWRAQQFIAGLDGGILHADL